MWFALIPMAIGAVGGMMKGKAELNQAIQDADALRRNAVFKENAAWDAIRTGMHDADWKRLEGRQLIGSQKVAAAANGGVVGDGSNAILEQDAAQLAEYDALVISNNAARTAYGYRVEAEDMYMTANNRVSGAKKGVMTSMLSGAISGLGSGMSGGMGGGMGGGAGSGIGSMVAGVGGMTA